MFNEEILQQGDKRKYVQIVLRVLKECRLLSAFREYIRTPQYEAFATSYAKKEGTTTLWYDRKAYYSILGCCNFGAFLFTKYGSATEADVYPLIIIYTSMFEPVLFRKEQNPFLPNISTLKAKLGVRSRVIVKKWEDVLEARKSVKKI